MSNERKHSVLVVEDDSAQRNSIQRLLGAEGYRVFAAENADKAYGYVGDDVDVVLSDLQLEQGTSGAELLRLWKAKRPETRFVMVTGHGTIGSAVECMKAGAFHYLTKPVNPEELLLVLRRSLEAKPSAPAESASVAEPAAPPVARKAAKPQAAAAAKPQAETIIGRSPSMTKVFDLIRRAAAVNSTVLILGESGTGKELVAQALHRLSPRKDGPLVAVNCAAVPANLVESELFGHAKGAFTGATDNRIGRFQQAHGGTLLIDEIGDMELSLQAKLLRVLETMKVTPVGGSDEKSVDVRVVAATSRPLPQMTRDGTFREDLFYRLKVLTIELPPLRDRKDDIPLLVEAFIRDIGLKIGSKVHSIEPEALARLVEHRWPGNIRELRNAIESMMVLAEGEVLTLADLPTSLTDSGAGAGAGNAASTDRMSADASMDDLEKAAITEELRRRDGNRTQAAKVLGISVRTLQRKLRRYEETGEPVDVPPQPQAPVSQ